MSLVTIGLVACDVMFELANYDSPESKAKKDLDLLSSQI